MARGLPDYYNPDTLVSQRLTDLNDLLTTVFRVSPLDNRGRMYWFDTFGEGLYAWILSAGFGGALPQPLVSNALIPPVQMNMDAGTTAGTSYSAARFRSLALDLTRVGFEIAYSVSSAVPLVQVSLEWDNGVSLLTAGLRINAQTGAIQIDQGGAWVQASSLAVPDAIPNWVAMKVVVDMALEEYVRTVIGRQELDLEGEAVSSQASSVRNYFTTLIQATSNGAGARTARVGYAIITVDEP